MSDRITFQLPEEASDMFRENFDRYEFKIYEEHDETKDMNEFLELLDTLEYSYKNGRTEESIVLLREKIINKYGEATHNNQAQDMETAPKDGTKILVELSDFGGFDIARWDGLMWCDNQGVSIPLDPIKWWTLPEPIKNTKHLCQSDTVDAECREVNGNLRMYVDGIDFPVFVCPFCGEKS